MKEPWGRKWRKGRKGQQGATMGEKGSKGLRWAKRAARSKGAATGGRAVIESDQEGFYIFFSPSSLRVDESAEFEYCFIPAACDRSDYRSEFFCFCGSESF